MGLKELIKQKEDLEQEIYSQVKDFLIRLDKWGEFAPTITKKFAGGFDSIESIECLDNEIILNCVDIFRGDKSYYSLRYPIDLVELQTDELVKHYCENLRNKRAAEKSQKENVDKEVEKEKELIQLKFLKEKYDAS